MIWTTREVMVLTSPDVAGLLNAYRVVKTILTSNRAARIGLVTSRARTTGDARTVYEKMVAVTRKHLGASIGNWGFIFDDLDIPWWTWKRSPLTRFPSGSRIGKCFGDITRRIVEGKAPFTPTTESLKTEFQGAGQESEPSSDPNDPQME
jgi:hypothetical protein